MSDLLDKILEKRKLVVEVGHITFIGRCPTYSKLARIINDADKSDDSTDATMAAKAIDDWIGVTEADIIPGGDPNKLVDFDEILFKNLIYDRTDWWVPISKAITKSVKDRQIIKETELKNSPAGTTTKPFEDSLEQG